MIVGFDARFADLDFTGVGVYTRELAKALACLETSGSLVLYVLKGSSLESLVSERVRVVSVASHVSYGFFTQKKIPSLLEKDQVEIFHSPLTAYPLFSNIPQVVTVHDLSWRRYPHNYSRWERMKQDMWLYLSQKNAQGIVAVSQATKRHFEELYPLAPSIEVTHLGINSIFGEGKREVLLDSSPYFLVVGGASRPRKQFEHTLRGFELLQKKWNSRFSIKITGPVHPVFEESLRLHPKIEPLGIVSEQKLGELFRRAIALIFLSPSEGYGMPVGESLLVGTPVITCSMPCVAEIFSPYVQVIEHNQPEQFVRACEWVYQNYQEAQDQAAKGREKALELTWERTARKTWEFYEKVLKSQGVFLRT